MPLQDAIRQVSQGDPNRPAILFEDQCWTYGELDSLTDRLASGLLAQGLRPGDRVGLLFRNIPGFVFAYYACFKAGLIATPVNIRMKGPEMSYVLNHSGARLLLGESLLFAELAPLRSQIPRLEKVFLVGEQADFENTADFTELLSSPLSPLPDIDDTLPVVIIYTSGTTARPKGVVHSHASLSHTFGSFKSGMHDNTYRVSAIVPSLSHLGSLVGLLLPGIADGGTVLLHSRFDPVALLQSIETHRVSIIWLLPVLYALLLQTPDIASYDLSSIRFCLTAGDSLPEPVRKRCEEVFEREVYECCGMTELIYSATLPQNNGAPGSIGKPLAGVEMRLVDEEGRDVAIGSPGEIIARGPGQMLGYWQDAEGTAAAFRDGWFCTGDLARQDENGDYWFVGRKKDIIIRGGSNIAPAEVEETLCHHPAVATAGVVGAPDPLYGQAVYAYVSLKNGQAATEEDLCAFLRERIALYKIPERIRILETLPVGLTGKIHRQTLRERAAMESLA